MRISKKEKGKHIRREFVKTSLAGMITEWDAHHIDTAHVGMGAEYCSYFLSRSGG